MTDVKLTSEVGHDKSINLTINIRKYRKTKTYPPTRKITSIINFQRWSLVTESFIRNLCMYNVDRYMNIIFSLDIVTISLLLTLSLDD